MKALLGIPCAATESGRPCPDRYLVAKVMRRPVPPAHWPPWCPETPCCTPLNGSKVGGWMCLVSIQSAAKSPATMPRCRYTRSAWLLPSSAAEVRTEASAKVVGGE